MAPQLAQTQVKTSQPMLSPVRVGEKLTTAHILTLKQHVMGTNAHVGFLKPQIAASKRVLAAADPATVNAVVVPGYPPPEH
jgi:hypothetical protein